MRSGPRRAGHPVRPGAAVSGFRRARARLRKELESPVRKIMPSQIAVFMLLAGISVALAGATAWLVARSVPPGDFRGLAVLIAFVLLVYVYSMVVYRVFLKMVPLEEGEIVAGSRAELAAQV